MTTTFLIHQDRRSSRNTPVEEITITVLGLDRVGKSSLLRRCFYNKFERGYTPTVEELHRGQLIYNGNKFNINVHEMGGSGIFYSFLHCEQGGVTGGVPPTSLVRKRSASLLCKERLIAPLSAFPALCEGY